MKRLALYHGEEFVGIYDSYAEIADVVGCSVNTARYYAMPIHHKRTDAQTTSRGAAWVVQRFDDEDEEE